MAPRWRTTLLAVVLVVASGCGGPGPRPVGRVVSTEAAPRPTAQAAITPRATVGVGYTNPVLDRDFPDPTVIRAADGRYYAYATQSATPEGAVNIQVASSPDLVHWKILGDALPEKAPWAATTQAYWAPHVHEAEGTYYLYYAAQPDGTEDTHCLGVATSRSPAGPFADKGEPFYCGDTGSDIDPMVFPDPRSGDTYMYWGSGGVLTVQQMAPDLLGFAPDGVATQVLYGGDYEYEGAQEDVVEGPWVVYREPYYYLFYSGDNCCSYPAHYAVMVARATDPTGPFEKLAEATGSQRNAILEAGGRWNGPGHGSVVTDADGRDWLAYHAIDTNDPYGPGGEGVRRVMLLDRLTYRDGWPRVGNGAPSERSVGRSALR